MIKDLLKSITLVIVFILLSKLYINFIGKLIEIDLFINLEMYWIYVAEAVFYIIISALLIWFYSVYNKNTIQSIVTINFNVAMKVVLLALLFRILEDPIHHYYQIFNNVDFPTESKFDYMGWKEEILYAFNIVILIPFCEELVFRKGIVDFLNKHKTIAIVVSSVLFMSIHIQDLNALNYKNLITVLLIGIVLAILYLRYGFMASFLFHCLGNALWFINEYNKKYYSDFIDLHGFGIIYWSVVILSFISFVYLLYNWTLQRS